MAGNLPERPGLGRGRGRGATGQANPRLPFVEGLTRYTGPLGSVFRTRNGLPAIGPPWASIVAYDLNDGIITWLWKHDLNANPEGLPSVFEVNGRQYVAFTASYYASLPD